jgi:hypothetical protein
MSTMTSIQEKAAEAASYFESAKKADDSSFIRTKDGTPEWVKELVMKAHGTDPDGSPSFLPDDYRYQWTLEALEFIAESDDPDDGAHDFADQSVSVYTADRIAWLGSNLQRPGYCDEAAEEFGAVEGSGIVDRIGWGQYMEASEVYGLVLNALQS